ncbi:hypothetical protein O3M35_007896 [Rhynocoris fuscipes]|uniref:Uncharacterized protein n=1 Tax=Rhynocoris fuscipes TaxID=488301 RepID=A0AAW1DAX9_9HEMI
MKNSEQEKEKVKKALKKGDLVDARIHAEIAAKHLQLSNNYQNLSDRVNTLATRVRNAMQTKTLTQGMFGAVRMMDVVMRSKNVEKITEVVEKFDRQFAKPQPQPKGKNGYVPLPPDSTILDEVENILKRASAEVAKDLNLELPEAATSNLAGSSAVTNSLIQRLKNLH